jgi:hypothetical protein
MAKDIRDPGTVDAFPRRGRRPLGERAMSPSERKRRSRQQGQIHEIRLMGKTAERFAEICDRLDLSASELVAHLTDTAKLPRKS